MKISLVILLIISLCTAFVFFAMLIKKLIDWQRIRKLSKNSINTNSQDKETMFAWLMRNGVSFLINPCEKLINRFKFLDNLFTNILILLEDKNFNSSKGSIASVFFSFCFLMFIFFSVVFSSVFAGLAIVLFLCVCLVTATKAALDKKNNAIRNSIPETLRSMSSCFGAGYTLYQTFNQICSETKGSINKLFSKSSHVLQTGGSVSQSLESLKNVSEAPELAFVAVALDVQHQTGGSMKPVIESAKEMVESKLELVRLLQVQTAQAKLSARIVMVLPFALVALFSIISPGFLTPFFSSFLGVVILCIAILMQALGIIMVKKMLNVEI